MKNIQFQLNTEYIELHKLLKSVKACFSGGEAKMCIEEEMVQVNGEIETRKRYKVRKGDIILMNENEITVQ